MNSVDKYRGADVGGKCDGRGRKDVRDQSCGSQNQKSSGGRGSKGGGSRALFVEEKITVARDQS